MSKQYPELEVEMSANKASIFRSILDLIDPDHDKSLRFKVDSLNDIVIVGDIEIPVNIAVSQ